MISPHTLFNLPYLRGKGIIEALPCLPDPTKSKAKREKYIRYVVPFAVLSTLTAASSFYGFNVWLLPISLELYGPNALYTMRNGLVLYAFTCSGFLANVTQLYSAPHVTEWSSGMVTLVGIVTNSIALVISGVCVTYKSEAGLFLSQFFLQGLALALLGYFTQIKTLLWFREIGRPVYGAATIGFGVGFWATTFSYWCPALIEGVSVPESFYWTAGIVLIFSLPGVFLLRSPQELPLAEECESGGDDGSGGDDDDDDDGVDDDDDWIAINESNRDTASAKKQEDVDPEEQRQPSTTVMNNSEKSTSNNMKGTPDSKSINEDHPGQHKDGIVETAAPALSRVQFEKSPQNHIQFLVWLLSFTVGFAPKYTLSPIYSSVFGASETLQSTTSFLFLASYTAARIGVAFAIGPRFSIDLVIRLSAGISALCFFFMGAAVFTRNTNKLWMWLFTAANMIVGFCLGSQKLCIQPISLKNWGINNVKQVVARVLMALRLASFVGPIIIWSALSRPGNIFLDPSLNTSEQQQMELEKSMGATLMVIGGLGTIAFTGQYFLIKPYKGR